jgi:hypothetical protein
MRVKEEVTTDRDEGGGMKDEGLNSGRVRAALFIPHPSSLIPR